MKISKRVGLWIFSVLLVSISAKAVPLKIVTVSAPEINCIFNEQCKNVVTDTTDTISWPSSITQVASAKLQSRTFSGSGATPGAGKTAYLYRVIALKGGSTDCVTGLTLDFGPVSQLDYNHSNQLSDVFVITKGGLGSVSIQSAEKVNNIITLTFTQGICNTVAQSTFFFGLAAATAPQSSVAQVQIVGSSGPQALNINTRVPTH